MILTFRNMAGTNSSKQFFNFSTMTNIIRLGRKRNKVTKFIQSSKNFKVTRIIASTIFLSSNFFMVKCNISDKNKRKARIHQK